MKRRAFLRGMAAAPLSAQVAAQEVALKAAGLTTGLAHGVNFAGEGAGQLAPSPGRQIATFAEWLRAGGEDELRRQANNVHSLDPDILCLGSVALWAKIQMQRDRNFEIAKRERGRWFDRLLKRDGFVRVYD